MEGAQGPRGRPPRAAAAAASPESLRAAVTAALDLADEWVATADLTHHHHPSEAHLLRARIADALQP